MTAHFTLDGHDVPFEPGQTVLDAAMRAGRYIPHLCAHPEFAPHGSCRVCVVEIDGRMVPSCTTPAREGDAVVSESAPVRDVRRGVVQFLFTEGNHFCPSCEASGRCALQAVGYELGVDSAHYNPLFPDRPVDASHPDLLLDTNRCILCELCVRASAIVDHKGVFALSGRGLGKHLVVAAASGRLGDTDVHKDDAAAHVCPVGAIVVKRRGFDVPIGARAYDERPIRDVAPERWRAAKERP